MEKNIEIEYKLLLTKKQYEAIRNEFHQMPYEQTNYYFDTKDEYLRKKRITLRVRHKNGQYEFTMKRFEIKGVEEYNEIISQQDFEALCHQKAIPSQILELLKEENLTIQDLTEQYALKTTRIDEPYKNGTLSLDLSEYVGQVDYELEYEVTSTENAIEDFNQFLEKYGLVYTENCKGKRHRLYDALTTSNH